MTHWKELSQKQQYLGAFNNKLLPLTLAPTKVNFSSSCFAQIPDPLTPTKPPNTKNCLNAHTAINQALPRARPGFYP